ncbi:ROK family transcriptional regulator [Humidisolicoccus flavus]|uniref:ROK family transcriptional regulator n=1 Tax=Humidisolicoccus flavus TaxID=3111414 RepID=UPI003245A14F
MFVMSDSARPAKALNTEGVGELLQKLRDGRGRTRSELAEITGLARSTITSRVDVLLASGLLIPAGEANSSGGRPPSRVAFNPLARIVIGVDLGATHGLVSISDLNGNSLANSRADIEITAGPEPILDWVVTAISELIAASEYDANAIAGIGIGIPGPVEFSSGRPTNPPIMPGWDRFDVPAYIRRHFDVPVLVDNDVNILALGELTTSWPAVEDLVFVKVSTGIGSGIVSGGQLQRGAQGAAGDLGHVQVPWSPGSTRDPSDERDLEAIASGPAIARQLREQGIDAHTSADVVELIRAGNATALEQTRTAGREIGEVLATVVNLLNPSVIVIGGSIPRASEQLIAGIREVVYRRSIPLATQHLGIVQSRGGSLAGVLGAGILAANHVLTPEGVAEIIAASAEA